MIAKIARLAGLGAFGACMGILAVYAGFVWLTLPVKNAGIDAISTAVGDIAVGGLVFALLVLHVVLGRQLLLLGQGEGKKHPL